MSWTTWAQIASLMVIAWLAVGSIVSTAIKERNKRDQR